MADLENFGRPKTGGARVMDAGGGVLPFDVAQERRAQGDPERETPTGSDYVTLEQVQAALNGLMAKIAALCATKAEIGRLEAAINAVAASANASFIRRAEAEQIAKEAVPKTIRDIDASADARAGNVMLLSPGGDSGPDSVYFGTLAAGSGEGMDWSQVALGYKINPTSDNKVKVRIYAGEINKHSSAETDLELEIVGMNEVYAKLTIADNTIAIEQGATIPINDQTYLYYRLYQFTVEQNTETPPELVISPALTKIYRPFDIETLEVEGSRTLFQGIFLREYDAAGNLIDAGSETGGGTLKPTWDWARAHG